ncbi:hypothetical protein BJF78_12595 [Pseudonocardia sp. CNS-139]|nr:hypothetical protein BJF78_12595 [Pseudonocardia sp. CNS-139]
MESLDEADPDEPDEVLAEIAQAQQLALQGDRAAAEQAFFELWEQIGPDGDPLHRTSVAHYMADVQESAQDELEWDLRALAAADVAAADELAADDVRGLYASLHVNLAADYDRLGRPAEARRHLGLAELAEADLPPDGYGDLVRSEIATVRERLGG